MESRRAFVGSPSSIFRCRQTIVLCELQEPLMYRSQHRHGKPSMVLGDQGNDSRSPIENFVIGNSQYNDMPELIVDIGDGDLDDNVIDVIRPDSQGTSEKRKKLRKRTGDIIDEITMPPESILTSDADQQPPISEDETTKYVRTAAKAADERKAVDILALRVSKLTYTATFIVIATGKNTPQIRAIGNLIEEDLAKKHRMFSQRRDGTANSGWLLLDCMSCTFSVVFLIFLMRTYFFDMTNSYFCVPHVCLRVW